MSNVEQFPVRRDLPQASRVEIFYCESPNCLRPHVMLLDHDNNPIAHFVCPDIRDDGSGFIARLYFACCEANVIRRGR